MINTERTGLRPITSCDNEKVFAYRSDSHTNKFQRWILKKIEEVNDFITKNPDTLNFPLWLCASMRNYFVRLLNIDKKYNKFVN